MKKTEIVIIITGVLIFLFSNGSISANIGQSGGSNSEQTSPQSVQTKTTTAQPDSKSVQAKTKTTKTVSKSNQTKSKPVPKSTKSETDNKSKDAGTVKIGTQKWAIANLNVSTFRNGDSIPEARTNKEWIAAGDAGKPAWCYYNNDPKIGQKYGKLYNWYAVNDPRGLAPAGWILPSDADWAKLINFLGGPGSAGTKMKSNGRWNDGTDGTNETGFTGFPEGYRVENGSFQNIGSMGIWWSTTENNPLSAFDHYLSQSSSLSRSNSPKQRGESVRCIKE